MIAKISDLVNRSYVTKSGNVGTLRRIGLGSLRCEWVNAHTEEDIAELEAWAAGIMKSEAPVGAKVQVQSVRDLTDQQERDAVRQFTERYSGEL